MKYLSIVLGLFVSLTAYSQDKDIVQTAGITSSFHEKNIGKIVFTSSAIPLPELDDADCMSSYLLTNTSDLYMTVFMSNSLTNYLHQLAPAMSLESITRNGNYQFALYVDNQLIYKDNLLPGAPGTTDRNTLTTFTKPLIDNATPAGHWTQYYWYRFLSHGGDSVLTDGNHLLRMEIRPYIKEQELITGKLIAVGELKLLVKRTPEKDIANIRLSPVSTYDGFAPSTEKFDKDKIKGLRASIDASVFKSISSVVVIKNGRLLVEEYFNGVNRNTLHDPRSVGKSFVSTIMGIAIHDGYIKNIDQKIGGFYEVNKYDHPSRLKAGISIRDLLTMSSVFDGNDDDGSSPGNEENMYPTDDWVKFTLDLPVDTIKPKGEWRYFTAGVVLLGDILNSAVPGGLEKYADNRLFQPLHITNYKWEYTPQHVVNTAGGIRMNALDFAKFGQLYKNHGEWNGKQIIPKEWVNETFTRHKKITGRPGEYYGFLFWNRTCYVDGVGYEAFYCAGNGGNTIFIFKDLPLVVVITATAYGAPYAHTQVHKMMEQYILPAITKQ